MDSFELKLNRFPFLNRLIELLLLNFAMVFFRENCKPVLLNPSLVFKVDEV